MIAHILAGDRQIYHELIRPYERSVYLVTLSHLKGEKEAETVAQETFIRAFHDLRTLPSDAQFGPWLIRLARNHAREKTSRPANKEVVPTNESHDLKAAVSPATLQDWSVIPPDRITCEETRRLLRDVVKELPLGCQEVFFLCDVEAFDAREVAQMLDIDALSVRTRLHRSRVMLRKVLASQLNTRDNLTRIKEK